MRPIKTSGKKNYFLPIDLYWCQSEPPLSWKHSNWRELKVNYLICAITSEKVRQINVDMTLHKDFERIAGWNLASFLRVKQNDTSSIYFLDQCVKLVYQESDLKGFYTLGHSSWWTPWCCTDGVQVCLKMPWRVFGISWKYVCCICCNAMRMFLDLGE